MHGFLIMLTMIRDFTVLEKVEVVIFTIVNDFVVVLNLLHETKQTVIHVFLSATDMRIMSSVISLSIAWKTISNY